MEITKKIAEELSVKPSQVEAAVKLIDEGCTIPFIARYRKEVTGSLNEQLSGLKLLQTENGLWRTILDDEESYEEVSASCGIAAAMLAKGNPLHIKHINLAIYGIKQHIGEDGRVTDVSGGTAIMKNREDYRTISKKWIQGWGQGLALTFLAGILDYDDFRNDGAL